MPVNRRVRTNWLAAGAGIVAGLAAGVTLSGCGSKPAEPTAISKPAEDGPAQGSPAETVSNLMTPFVQAVIEDLGEEQVLPPDRTVAGKATAPLREAVEKLWPTIALTDGSGRVLPYVVTLETDEGPVEITLHPEWAPNHVRNFLTLVKVGYYDGLKFDRVIHQEAQQPDGKKFKIDMLKAGCPAGTGDPGIGHIGYHLKPEFSDTLKHEEGTVGMSRDVDPSTAGVRFYITLGPAPALDGNFSLIGKVTKGLDVVKRISEGKLLSPEIDPAREFPEKPVTLKKATAQPDPVGNGGGVARAGR